MLTLALGGLLQGEGPTSDWYQQMEIAPWTPPGVVFGIAWTTIMICLAIYMNFLTEKEKSSRVYILFGVQVLLNVIWNPVFFHFHLCYPALFIITALFILIAYFAIRYFKALRWKSLLIFPYLLWLLIAISLNAYFCLMN
jgi:tryptophan-rich sensory protein